MQTPVFTRATRRLLTFAAALVALALVGTYVYVAHAADQTWDGGATGGGTAWFTVTNWVGDTAFPGSQSATTNADVATIPSTAANPAIGINMNFAGNTLYLGAINFTGTNARSLGDSSAIAGTLQLNGASVDSVANVILRHSGTGNLTLQAALNGTMGVALGNVTDNIINVDGTGAVTISSSISGANRKLTKAGSGGGFLTLSGANTYSGETTISAGTLALSGPGTINNSPSIVVAAGAAFDVSGVTPASYALASGQTLSASGAAAPGTLALGAKNLSLASNSPLQFHSYNGTVPPLTTAGTGTLVLAGGNPVTVTVSRGGIPLAAGNYLLVSRGTGGGVSGTAPSSVTVGGDGVAAGHGATLSILGGELYLVVFPPAVSYRSKQSGNWNSASTWESSTDGTNWVDAAGTPSSSADAIAIRNSHTVNVTASVEADQLTVGAGGVLLVNGGVTFNVADGTGADLTVVSDGLLATAGAVGNNGQAQINGTLRIDQGGFFSGSPSYAATSTLKYNTGGSYGRNGEWLPGATSGPGYPYHVRLANNTTLDLPNGSTAQAFQMAGDLAIDAGSTMSLAGPSPLTRPLKVLGSVSNSGSLVLSTLSGGDLEVGHNWTRAAAATFTTNGRAVTFNGTTNQIVSVQGGGTESFAYLVVDKAAGSLTPDAGAGFVTDLAVNATTGAALRLLNSGGVDLNGRTLALNGNGGDLLVSGGARTITSGAGTGTFGFNGAKTITSASGGTLGFGVGVNVNVNAAVTLSADATVNGTLALGANNVTTAGGNTLNIGAAGSVTRSSGYIIGTERKSFDGAGSFTFDVGTANGYTPVDASVTAGAGSLSVKATQAKHPNVAGANALSRYWTLAGAGVTSDLTFHYLAGDVAGAEANYKIFKYDGGAFTQFTPDALDTTNHTATLNGVSSFSDWTLAEPASVFGGPAISVGDLSVAEPSSGVSHAVFPVTLSAASAQAVTVNFATADGTATQPGDYTSAGGTVIFDPGETSKTIAVVVKADALSDTPEDFGLNLSSPSNATVADGTGVATITAPVAAGTVLISEFRLRGPGTGNNEPADFDTPVVTLPSGRKLRRPAKSAVEEEDGPSAPRPPTDDDDGGGGTGAPPTAGETDEFVEIYNNTDADIVVTDANAVTCALQVITAGPADACGWALVDLQGSTSNIPRFVIPAGTVIPARGHYLAAGTGYSLSGLAAPDQTYNPPAYSGGEADYTGLALFKTADRAQFTPANVFDAVGFDGVATPYREGSGLPLFGVAEDVQHSFVRNQPSSLPSDTGDNRADFTLVATNPAQLLSGTATLGAPGPENGSGPVTRNSGFGVTTPPGILSSVRSLTPVTNGSLGTLSLRRRFTNNTGRSLNRLRFRVVQVTTYNNKQVFANQAEVRVLDAQLAGLGGTGLVATTVETPPAQGSGGGVNTGLVLSGSLTLPQPLAAGQSADVEFLLGVMRGGAYQFVVVVEGAP